MKAIVAEAEWAPRDGYKVSEKEETLKRAESGAQVFRNPTFALKEAPVPSFSDDEILIRVKKCGICGTDTHLYETDNEGYIIFSGPVRMPSVIGHEYAGYVEAVGKNVTAHAVGDRVAMESVLWCGRCRMCRSGAVNQCRNVELAGVTVDGAMAEYAVAKEWHCWNIDSLSERYEESDLFEVGALIEPAGCAYNGLFISAGGFLPGAVVTVFGLGPIGLSAVAFARLAGASKIIAFDTIDRRVALGGEMGADHALNISNLEKTPSDTIMELTDGRGADVQVEAAGAAHLTIPEMETSMAVRGKIVYLGRAARKVSMYLDSLVSSASSIVGSRGHAGYGIFPNIIELVRTGRLPLEKLVTRRASLAQAVDALATSCDRCDGRIIIDI